MHVKGRNTENAYRRVTSALVLVLKARTTNGLSWNRDSQWNSLFKILQVCTIKLSFWHLKSKLGGKCLSSKCCEKWSCLRPVQCLCANGRKSLNQFLKASLLNGTALRTLFRMSLSCTRKLYFNEEAISSVYHDNVIQSLASKKCLTFYFHFFHMQILIPSGDQVTSMKRHYRLEKSKTKPLHIELFLSFHSSLRSDSLMCSFSVKQRAVP